MKINNAGYSFTKESSRCYRKVSERAEKFIEQLNEVQVQKLTCALKSIQPHNQWKEWLISERKAIGAYDRLDYVGRERFLQTRNDNEILLIHHACIYIELWRVRIDSKNYFNFRDIGLVDRPVEQREMLLGVLSAWEDIDPQDLWLSDV